MKKFFLFSKSSAFSISESKLTFYLLSNSFMFIDRDDNDYQYEDWALRIRDKLNRNANRFHNDQTATVYVISRIDKEASEQILIYRLQDSNYFKNLSMIFDVLHDIYANFERQKTTRLTYKQIKQKKNQSFVKFYIKFMFHDRMLQYSNDYLMLSLKNKINMQLRKALINRIQAFESLQDMKMWMHRMNNYHRRLKQEKNQKRSEKTAHIMSKNRDILDRFLCPLSIMIIVFAAASIIAPTSQHLFWVAVASSNLFTPSATSISTHLP